MTPYYADPLVTLYLGDCLDVMRELPDASVDSVVTDPPYGLEFMGREWDRLGGNIEATRTSAGGGTPVGRTEGLPNGFSGARVRFGTSAKSMQAWHEQWATEAFRVLKPGGYLLAFGGTRTYHRLASAIEDAGFEIRDTLMWVYASGFPKSLDVSKALDKVAGAEREVTGYRKNLNRTAKRGEAAAFHSSEGGMFREDRDMFADTAPATDLARKWEGWGTALKPAHEPIVMARKPLVGSVAANVSRYGTGALNIGATRITANARPHRQKNDGKWIRPDGPEDFDHRSGMAVGTTDVGRWPSNVLLSDPALFDEPNPEVVGSGATSVSGAAGKKGSSGFVDGYDGEYDVPYGDSGGYSRFFLIPKADRAERERGLTADKYELGPPPGSKRSKPAEGRQSALGAPRFNSHPTVKPIDLMRHLVKLVTPPGGTCLDPFLGSGTTALAASELGIKCVGIEREQEYLEIAKGRLMATPMGLGLDVPAGTERRSTTGRQGPDKWERKAPKHQGVYQPWWGEQTPDEEPAA